MQPQITERSKVPPEIKPEGIDEEALSVDLGRLLTSYGSFGPGSDPLDEGELSTLKSGFETSSARRLAAQTNINHIADAHAFVSHGDSKIDTYIDALPFLPAPPLPPAAPVLVSQSSQYSGNNVCVTGQYHAGISAIELAALAPNSDTLWPGSLVSGASLYSGLLTPLKFPRNRCEVTVSNAALSAIATEPLTVSVKSPSLDTVSGAVADLLRHVIPNNGVKAFTGGITIETYHSISEAAMHLDASASWLGGNVRNTLDISSSTKKSHFIISLVQGYYDLLFSTPLSPGSIFRGVTLEDIRQVLGPNPAMPAYVSTIRYGRMLIIQASSDASESQLSDSLHLAIGGITTSGQLDASLKNNTAVAQTSFQMVMLGGDQSSVVSAIGGFAALQHINDIWQSGAILKKDTPPFPVSYQLRWLGRNPKTGTRNDSAALTFTSEYSVQTCTPQSIIRFGARFRTTGDDKDGGEKVEIDLLNGSELLATYWCDAPFNHKWDNNTSQPDGSDAHFGGVPGWYSTPSFTRRAFSTEIPSLRLRVRKTGSDGWTFQVSAALWLESGQVIEFVQFGREKHFEDADESELYP